MTAIGYRRGKTALGLLSLCPLVLAASCCMQAVGAQEVPVRVLELAPGKDNPRNSEGSFVTLKDGRILFVYTHYAGGGGGDNDPAYLAGRYSSDGGRTWTTEDRTIVEKNQGGMNVMSVSLLRLQSGEIALFYLLKNSEEDCRPVLRLSTDEGTTWGPPTPCITDEVGYYVLNNDRVIQLKSGRLVAPVALHVIKGSGQQPDWNGTVMCYLSDDSGKTWRRSQTAQKVFDAKKNRVTAQEPGVVELKDGRVLMFIRASGGFQYLAYSQDGGDTWSAPVASTLASPVSPASIERLPSTGDLLLVWNNHADIPASLRGRRVPLSVAISKDDGATWQHVKVLEGNPQGWYCYIAIHPVDDAVLLGYCARGLALTRVTRVPVAWLYTDAPPAPPPQPSIFDAVAPGAFERLETKLGVWSAAAGQAEVLSYERGKGVRLQGGTDRTVTLTLPQAIDCKALELGVERFTAQAPYALTLEAKTGDTWRKIWEQGATAPVGRQERIRVTEAGLKATEFRFRCTSALGAIISDAATVSLNGFFND
jgi:sialidase-1